ncbi:MAG: molybdopterin-dependent oxidoreductase, partial [Anaerolineae bacterium]|nr:molybdopterin-dependent oxidoreductase [Anaerolineae bacterium]
GEEVAPFAPINAELDADAVAEDVLKAVYETVYGGPPPALVLTPPEIESLDVVGKGELKVDAVKLVTGRPVFTDDITLDGMLYGALLTSPHAHARIRRIDVSKARELPGVAAVLTHEDVPRYRYTSAGQSFPAPLPYDQAILDYKVRHFGDRVAVVAAETPELARRALRLIEVDYEVLPHVLDPEAAMRDGAPVIHDEDDVDGIYDAKHNIVHHIEAECGDVDAAWERADYVFEGEYRTSQQQQTNLEPHACITYWDDDGRLVVRTSTQVPFHIRRMLAELTDLVERDIRVIKPRIGGGFGNKQELILEDLCTYLTMETGRPVRMVFTRQQEFTSSRSRHPQVMRYKIGVTKEQEVVATELNLIGDTGAYGAHGLTVQMVGGQRGLTLYNAPNARFVCDVVYTNKPTPGAFRGYGAMQCYFGVEVLMAEIAEQMGWDVVEFKRKNWIKQGEPMYLSRALGEGREGYEQVVRSSSLGRCVDVGLAAMGWADKRGKMNVGACGPKRSGIGMAIVMHGSGIAGLDMASATIKMDEDGSFNLFIGATDIGTGSDTILAQMAAEVLGVRVEDFIVYSSDTDFTPFDKGAYASSTTYISGGAVRDAAGKVADQIREHARVMMGADSTDGMELRDRKVWLPDGSSLSLRQVAQSSLHMLNQHQIIASGSFMSYESPPPFGVQFVEVEVDTETGQVNILKMTAAHDFGRAINPKLCVSQIYGGIGFGVGYALFEEGLYDPKTGKLLTKALHQYKMPTSLDFPQVDAFLTEAEDPYFAYSAKGAGENINAPTPAAIRNAVYNAIGIWFNDLPITPDKIIKAIEEKRNAGESLAL